jgi:hypothetical protein
MGINKGMDINNIISNVESSDEYKDFIKNNPHHYLAHLFSLMDSEHKNDWQLGYYSKETDKITVFDYLEDGTLSIMPPQEAFKEKNYIEPLDIGKVKVSKDQAIAIVDKIIKENYKAESLSKMIILLQNLPEHGQIWNITIVTTTFSVINIKIDSKNGTVIKHSKESLIGWKKE